MASPELSLAGAVATITLRRPEQANRLSADDLGVLAGQIARVNDRPEVLVLELRGQGKYFCSGYDIGSIGQPQALGFEEVVNALEDARPVTVAVLHGSLYGGATDLALACDFRIGAAGIDMFMPAARLGLHFYQRGLERYMSRLGLNNAKRLFLTAEKIDAQEMKAIGFLTHLVEGGDVEQTVARLSQTCSAMAPLSMLGMKRHLNLMARGALNVEDLQRDMAKAASSSDLREGLAAWSEKRPPRFTGQ